MPEFLSRSNRPKRVSRSTIIVVLCFLLSITAAITYSLQNPYTLALRFDPYALLSLLPIAVNLLIIILIVRLRVNSEESVWFILYLCGITVAGVGEAMQRFSATPEAAVYWFQMNSIGFILMPIAYYLFVFSYVKPLRSQSPLLISSLLTSVGFMMLYFVGTNQFYNLDPSAMITYPWGFNPPTGPMFWVLFIWVEMLLFVAFLTLVRFYRHASSDLIRRQAKTYTIAILIPIIGGSLTDGILPLIGINTIVPMSIFLSTITSVVAFYGLRKYRLFQINPAVFAENVISTMHEAVIVTDTEYKIDFVNREAENILGAASGDLSGTDISERFTPDSWDSVLHARQDDSVSKSITRDTDIDKLQVIRKSGEKVPVRVYTSRLDEGTPNEACIFIISDISDITASYHQLRASTERIRSQNDQLQDNQVTMERLLKDAKELQHQLQNEKENVEHTVDVRTAELREARDKLKASDELKSEFIMLSSHNLRTPLSIMQSSVELLSGSTNLSDEQKMILGSLSGSTDRLREFVEDLLAIATLEAGDELKLSPMGLEEIITPLIKETETMAKAKGLTFKSNIIAPGKVINANSLRLRGAIRNILHNAVNFTQTGEVRLVVDTTSDHVRIIIEDTGIGIAPEELPNLFTKFHRATSTLVYNYQGGGIGLYLTKLVVEEHKGRITAESTLGQGSTFTVELPLFKPDSTPATSNL